MDGTGQDHLSPTLRKTHGGTTFRKHMREISNQQGLGSQGYPSLAADVSGGDAYLHTHHHREPHRGGKSWVQETHGS